MEITRPSIVRLARKAGIKSISEECFQKIRTLITFQINNVVKKSLIVNSEHQTKTLMTEDIYESLSLTGENLTQSNDLGTTTIQK
jgi:histone H3/H4